MLEGLKDALEHVEGLARENEKTEVIEICGHTYANKNLKRYDNADKARELEASSLTALIDYIRACHGEFPKDADMIVHIVDPKRVRLISALDAERTRECLFKVTAEVNEFRFGHWYDQEEFMIELQANFNPSDDLTLVRKMAGNVERKNDQSYTDDGISQVATMTVGAAAKADVVVPNPVTLVPFRTFQEVSQPASAFVFRVGGNREPSFMLQEAQNGLWRNEAVANIKAYLAEEVSRMPNVRDRITIIG